MSDIIVERLRVWPLRRGYSEVSIRRIMRDAADEIEKLRAERVALRAALQPLAKLFLFPDDLGFEAALDIKSDQDWDVIANDMQTEEVFILRRYIRVARAALGEQE